MKIPLPLMRAVAFRALLPSVFAGLTAGLVSLVYSISFAALIFSGSLSHFFPQGVGCALIGATITAIVVARYSVFPYALAGSEANSVVIVALIASAIATALESTAARAAIYPTIWAAIGLSSLCTGLFLWTVGRLQLGHWARFIPYPVIGGFLAGTGWLVIRSSFKVMVGHPLELAALPQLCQLDSLSHWVPGLVFALVTLLVLPRYRQFWVLPGLLFLGVMGFHGLWGWLQLRGLAPSPEGWFFTPFPNAEVWQFWQWQTLTQIDGLALLHQSGTLIALMLVVLVAILMNATGLELTTATHVDLNQELRANGIANIVNGLCGGMIGHLSFNRTQLNHQAGANRPLAGMVAGGLCAVVLLSGSSFLAYLPKPILGGLLLYLGLQPLIRWVYWAWFIFPRLDYLLIQVILVTIALWGFLPGIAVGIVIACGLFVIHYGQQPACRYETAGAATPSNVRRSSVEQSYLRQQGDAIYILVLQGFIFFGTANTLLEKVRRRLQDTTQPRLQFVIFDFRLVGGLDSSVVLSFSKLKRLAQESGFQLVFTHLDRTSQAQLVKGGVYGVGDPICQQFADRDRGLEWCETQLLESSKLRRRRFVPLAMQLQTLFPNPELVPRLMAYLKSVRLQPNEVLFHQGDAFDGLYFLESGRVTVMHQLPDGTITRLRSYTGGVIGEKGLYQPSPRLGKAIAEQTSSLYWLSTAAFAAIVAEDPQLAASFHLFMIGLLTAQLDHYEHALDSL